MSQNLMKVLWFGRLQTASDIRGNGSWQDEMAQALARSGEVRVGNIAQGQAKEIVRRDVGAVQQWVIPSAFIRMRDGQFVERHEDIVRIVDEFSPDLIHIWGVEEPWGLLTARGIIRASALLEMQGLKGAIARVFAGGLSIREQLECIGLKEIIRGTTIFQARRQFERWGKVEREIIRGHRFITAQSLWMRVQIVSINPSSTIYHPGLTLREPFYTALPWLSSDSMRIFCSAAYSSPFKGLHIALRAIAILKRRFPKVQLRIAGPHQRQGIRQDGYVRWLNRQIKKLNIVDNVYWLGNLSALEIISELQGCAAMILPSFIEGYSLALAEGMMLGVPSVDSFTGGMSSLARDDESALFFSPGDEVMCAYQLERLLTDRALAERIGRQAREVAMVRNDRERIVRNQIEIYRQVLGG